jgi:hypothetical protein
MKRKGFSRLLVIAGTLLCLSIVIAGRIGWQAALAAPARQIPIYTPTPGPDGRIIYIVKANDTLLSIALLTGQTVDEIKALNKLTTDTIFEGQELLLGFGGPLEITATSGPSPTPTQILPTSTPRPGLGNLCLLLYDDRNGDSIRQLEELSIGDGAISFGNRAGSVSENLKTVAGQDYQCFNDLPEGDYTISVAVPEGWNATTQSTYELKLGAGDQTYLNFGAQANTQTQAEEPTIPAEEGRRSPLLGVIGAVFLVAGLGAAIFAGRILRNR